MAFVRAKKSLTSGTYYQLVEAYRDGERVRQRVLAYLGKYATVEAAGDRQRPPAAHCSLTVANGTDSGRFRQTRAEWKPLKIPMFWPSLDNGRHR
jgi:hypothetical protein